MADITREDLATLLSQKSQQMVNLELSVVTLERENAELKEQLNAIDPRDEQENGEQKHPRTEKVGKIVTPERSNSTRAEAAKQKA
ncbi:MAG: hypothetical protein IIA64_04860 [Planctomycetes bacterium]|nr:hypothetical protein [Planctomycetota bacterium]